MPKPTYMTKEERLRELRRRWKKEPHNRKIIEMQAKLLKMGDPEVERVMKELV